MASEYVLGFFLSYKHAIDGLVRVYKEEGVRRLFSGASTATSRAIFMTIGQLSFYDQVKMLLLRSGVFGDNMATHFLSSLTAVRDVWNLKFIVHSVGEVWLKNVLCHFRVPSPRLSLNLWMF